MTGMRRAVICSCLIGVLSGCKGKPEAAGEGARPAASFEYVVCLLEPGKPDDAMAVLKRKDRFFSCRAKGQLQIEDAEIDGAWLISVAPSVIVYEDAGSPHAQHRVAITPRREPISVPARFLASFVGRLAGSRLISSPGLDTQSITVPTGEATIDARRAKELLSSSGSLTEIPLEDGRTLLSWNSIAGLKARPAEGRPSSQPVLLISRQDSGAEIPIGQPVDITSGTIPLMDFLVFVSNYAGLPVYSAVEPSLLKERSISIVSDLQNADLKIVEKLLEINGISLEETTIPEAGKALLVKLR